VKSQDSNTILINLLNARDRNERCIKRFIGNKAVIVGVAKNAKGGAILKGEDINIVVKSLDEWPAKKLDRRMILRGDLSTKWYPTEGYGVGWSAIPLGRIYYIDNYTIVAKGGSMLISATPSPLPKKDTERMH
jgi:hypothetical protein